MLNRKKIYVFEIVLGIIFSISVIFAQDFELMQTYPATPGSSINGSQLGSEITNIGDVNGDSYDDWAAGFLAAADINSSEKTGKVYIYLSKSSPVNNADPDIILKGEEDMDYFGASVAGAGDVNNDGYDDIIVGACYNNDVTGKAYIYYGGELMDTDPDIVLSGESTSDYFGCSVSGAGDVNKDNFDDVIVGAKGAPGGGRAYIYFGGLSMDNTADVILVSESTGDDFGHAVSYAGDVNNDTYDDVIVGAWLNGTNGTGSGSVYVYLGGVSMDSIPDVTLRGENPSDYFGYSISNAGDVNNDNYDDIIVGARRSTTGKGYIFLGGMFMNNVADVILEPEASGDYFGRCVSDAGDVNGDGYGDVLVGASRNDRTGYEAGSAYIYFGSAEMDNTMDLVFSGEAESDNFGISVSAAGDLNNDTFPDIIIGASGNDDAGLSAGKVYIYYGAADMDTIADFSYTGKSGNWHFGESVASAGDLNDDGFDDIIVGAVLSDDSLKGQAFIYFGGAEFDNEVNLVLKGEEYNDRFGRSVACAGDVNGDNYSDVIVGAYINSGYDPGKAYIYFGGSAMDADADVILTGLSNGDAFGCSVASAGDVNNDGYDDVVVGAYQDGETSTGHAYIYFGGPDMDNSPDLLLNSCDNSDGYTYLGISVSSAGDVNNDGYDDVIAGAYQAGEDQEGQAFIYYGGMPMDNVADDTLSGALHGDRFGYSVSSAGDVNNDGYDDVIVGAYEADVQGEKKGRTYVFFGGQTVDKIPDAVFTGEADDDCFGFSVSAAGDIDNDNFDDIVIGAYLNSGDDGWENGRAYVFRGAAVMDNIADIVYSGESRQDNFGYSVSCAGDVNGNGYDDIIIGANNNSMVGYQMGKAYVYGSPDTTATTISANGKNLAFDYILKQNYPNPFNPATCIEYTIPVRSNVKITIYNILGETVKSLVNNVKPAGAYSIRWNGLNNSGNSAASGIYICQMQSRALNKNITFKDSKRLLLLR